MKRGRKPRASRFTGNICHEAITTHLGEQIDNLNISAVARALDVYTCKVWHYFKGRNKWPAEDWFKTLIVIGMVHESRERFEIYIPKTRRLCLIYDKLKKVNHAKRKGDVVEHFISLPAILPAGLLDGDDL